MTMTKKTLRPQQVAPVQRETTGTSSQQGQMTASIALLPFLAPIIKAEADKLLRKLK